MAVPVVTIKQGHIRGTTDTDLNGETYYKFVGIPYAKPPVGPLRFKDPQPAESWSGIRDATKDGNPCLAMDFLTNNSIGSEDCLFLNVYTKQLPKAGVSPKPVMFHIHGGAFTLGTGSEVMAGSRYLVAEDVVFVSINYRLGIFGFLSSDDLSLNIPGNAGLKDQAFALKWVQDNIASFNGDPNNVTIFGISAGGASVHFQVLSPLSKGLFHKAIAQSGSTLNPWAWGQKNVIQVAEKLGTHSLNDKDALDVLINTPAEELFLASQKLPDVLLDATKRRPFGPVVEKSHPKAFLSENPSDLLKSGRFNQVPLILGCTSNEGSLSEMKKELFFSSVNPKEAGAFWSLDLDENNQKREEIKAKINDFYFKNGETTEAVHEIIGDVGFMIGIMQAAKLALIKSKNPLYVYVFSYEIKLSKLMFQFMGVTTDIKGVPHGGDGGFIFSSEPSEKITMADPKQKEETLAAIRHVTKLWADFARTGRPHELWEPVTDVDKMNYFNIDKVSQLKLNPFAERVALWDEVLKEVTGIDTRLKEKPTY